MTANPHVFVSYSSKDRGVANAVLGALEAAGARCWIAPRDIQPGRDWGESIVEAIEASRVMVLVFSGHANTSPQVRREVERAVNKGVTIVPFRIENVPPCKSLEYFISVGHWLDAYADPLEVHLARLGATVVALAREWGRVEAGAAPAVQPTGSPPFAGVDPRPRPGAKPPVLVRRPGGPIGPPVPDATDGSARPPRRRLRPVVATVAVASAFAAGAVARYSGGWPRPAQAAAAPTSAAPAAEEVALPGSAVSETHAKAVPTSPITTEPAAGRGGRDDATGGPVRAAPPARPPAGRQAPLAPQPAIDPLRAAWAAEVASLHLTSVAVIGKQRFCVIDGTSHREGESVRGFVVQSIRSDRVLLARNGLPFELRPDVRPAEAARPAPPEVQYAPPVDRPGPYPPPVGFGMYPPPEGDRPPPPQGPPAGGGPGRRPGSR